MTENSEREARGPENDFLNDFLNDGANGTDGMNGKPGDAMRAFAEFARETVSAAAAEPAPAPSAATAEPPAEEPQPPADGQSALVTEILRLIAPLTEAVANPHQLAALLARTGWNPAAAGERGAGEVAAWLETAASAVGGLEELVAHPPQDLEGLGLLLDVVGNAVDLVREVPPALGAFDAAAFAEDVVHFLVTDWLLRHHQVLYHVLVLLGVVVLPEEAGPQSPVVNQDGEPVRTDVARARLRPQRLVELVTDPVASLRADYLPRGLVDEAAADALAATLLPRLGGLLHELGVRIVAGLGDTTGSGLDEASVALGRRMLTLGIPVRLAPGIGGEIGATLGISSPGSGGLGVVVVPRGAAAVDQLLGGGWALRADLSGAGPAVSIGPQGVAFATDTAGRVELALEVRKTGEEQNAPALLLGSATGTRLEVGAFRAWLKAVLEDTPEGAEGRDDVEIGIAADKAAVVVAGGDGDGFLAKVLPPEGLRTEFALGLQWSRRKGLSFTGSAGLDATLPVNTRLGPIELQALHLQLGADTADGKLRGAVSATARLALGPVQATVERFGLGATLATTDGNLGPVGLGAAFDPPKGAALAVGAGPVTGGGYLFFDERKQEYAGVLALQLESIALKAVGLLTTRMPDGSEGFSLLILVSAEFTPIQLGFGFTLAGVGGLIGINRSVSVDALRAGIRTRALDSVLFPRDPLARAPEIIATLGAVLPPTPGRHVVGPMARIGWGTPTLLTLDLGLLLELPTPVRLVILGRLRMALPTEEAAAVVVNMDVLGVIDFERGEASVDATLYDSRIAAFPLTGDMAMRARWKGTPSFALSAGGFHPRFQRPEGFPELRRLNLALLSGDNPRVRLEAYFALTSNTLQFGARLELYAAALGFSVEGLLAFDALVQFDPFGFEAVIAGHLALKRGSRTLMGIGAEVALSGPAPWHVRGRARFELLFFSGEISFDRTLGERGASPASPAAVNVTTEVEKALADPRNWTAQLTGTGRTLVTLRELPQTEGQLIVHPLGGLSFTQRVAPLGVTLAHVGNAPVDGDHRVDLERELTVEDTDPATEPVTVRLTPTKEYFAPAQFLDLTDEEKISAPSFDLLTAGATAEDALDRRRELAGVFASPIAYEEIVEDGPHRTATPGAPAGPALRATALRTAAAPAARAATRRSGRRRFAAAPRSLGVRDTRWTVAGPDPAPQRASLRTATGPASGPGTTWTEAAEHRRALRAEGLRLVPETAPGGDR
ncbi:DUF6603 domain-containing protein [Streptomyces sp. NPDC046805]|uniref:DUF6603 domain-containing protein n=1 Tax=Streptomyces sp. NPDC046805 TaxID=3155134 RepID=UPI0033E4DAB3